MTAARLATLIAISLLSVPGSALGANRVESALASHTAGHPQTGAVVWRLDPAGPTVIASYKPETARLPASTMKLVTAAGAMIAFDPEHRFVTRVYTGSGARLAGGTLRGNLYLVGGGDPTLATARYTRDHLRGKGSVLARLARPLKRRGIARVRGRIVADATIFDSRRTGPRWLSHYTLYCPPLSGLTSNQSYGGNGQRGYAARPELTTGVRFRGALRGVGVRTNARVVTGRVPSRARPLAAVASPPLRTVVRLMNLSSDNHIAETLLKGIAAGAGGAGTSAAGAREVNVMLRARGVLGGGDTVVDGSGLSRANRLSPASLVRLLSVAERSAWGPALFRSLPRGGEGTLERRFRGTSGPRVRAKTGYLSGVSTLAGRVVSRGGKRYVFALLMNDSDIRGARTTQDRIVTLLASGAVDGAAGSPVGP